MKAYDWCYRRWRGLRRWLVKKGLIKALCGPTPEEVASNPVFQDPGAKEQGPGYQPKWGATIYPDSKVLRPYIGSAEEEAASLIKPKPVSADKTGTTCPDCGGWGVFQGFTYHPCKRCRGAGTI